MSRVLIIAGPHEGRVYDGPTMGRSFELYVPGTWQTIAEWPPTEPSAADDLEILLYHIYTIRTTGHDGNRNEYDVAMPHDNHDDPAHVAVNYLFWRAMNSD